MTTVPAQFVNQKKRRFAVSTLLIPLVGVIIGLAIMGAMIFWFFDMPTEVVADMVIRLGVYAIGSIVVSLLLYWAGWLYSPSIRWTFLLMTLIVGGLTLFNGWVAASAMFVDRTILIDTAILLLFTTVVSTAFGVMGFTKVTESLADLTDSARRLAQGDMSTRVDISGRDEMAKLGFAFNEMAVRLEEAQEKREQVEQLRRDLIAWVSHDLRTPLTSIRAMVEALNDGVVDDQEMVSRYYRTILSDVMGLNRLIDDLFELAQLDAGGLTFDKETHSLSDLISDSLESFQELSRQRGIVLEGDVSDDLDPVLMNSGKIGRVLNNLISNALKYTPEDGMVTVSASRKADGVHVYVTDSGAGFNEEDLPRVFEKFYRGEGARSRLHGSSAGLGLAIARGIVEGHGGAISAENVPSQGARVSFVLPTS